MVISDNNKKFERLRNRLNLIDNQLIKLLVERFEITAKIADVKNQLDLPLTDLKREKEIIERLRKLTKNILLQEIIGNLYHNIFALSKTARNFIKINNQPFSKISIIGLGLIGGSIAKALKSKNNNLQIFTLKRKSINNLKALKEKLIDSELENLEKLVKESELIILASSIDSIIPYANKIARLKNLTKNKLVVIDVASVKEKITHEFERLTDHKIEFVATHPMAGSEKSGYDASSLTLFVNQPWIITPHRENTIEITDEIENLINYLGSRAKVIDPKEHDALAARISHLIFLISTCLFAYSQQSKEALQMAGTGFETVTRLTSANPIMHSQILDENFENIHKELSRFIDFIKNKSLNFFQKNKIARDKFIKDKQ